MNEGLLNSTTFANELHSVHFKNKTIAETTVASQTVFLLFSKNTV